MFYRTDLALEENESRGKKGIRGVLCEEEVRDEIKITRIEVQNEIGALRINKPVGKYITIEMPPLSDSSAELDERYLAIADELMKLLPSHGEILVAGLGNAEITPDALGPKVASGILATRHISGELQRTAGLPELRSVAVLTPGVLGRTGIETAEMIRGVAEKIGPSALIVVDALASRSLERLGCTVQISTSGINPGSGVGNHRKEISSDTMGVPVIAVGVPTVVDAMTLVAGIMGDEADTEKLREQAEPRGAQMVVTPREIDLLIGRAAKLISVGINKALNPMLSGEELVGAVS